MGKAPTGEEWMDFISSWSFSRMNWMNSEQSCWIYSGLNSYNSLWIIFPASITLMVYSFFFRLTYDSCFEAQPPWLGSKYLLSSMNLTRRLRSSVSLSWCLTEFDIALSILKNAGQAIKVYIVTFIKQLIFGLWSPLFSLWKCVIENSISL